MIRIICAVLGGIAAAIYSGCASLSQEQIIANDQSRLKQQAKGYFDREDSAEEKKAAQRAEQEALHRKS